LPLPPAWPRPEIRLNQQVEGLLHLTLDRWVEPVDEPRQVARDHPQTRVHAPRLDRRVNRRVLVLVVALTGILC
jgi:hypothetical protein